MTQSATKPYLTVKEAAKLLGIASSTIHVWIDQGRFPGTYKLDPAKRNSPMRIPAGAVESLLKERQGQVV